jgi:arabinose-5-phosphate isomerase
MVITSSHPIIENDFLKDARTVLSQESHALLLLADTLGETFIKAIHLIDQCTGRLIVTGMGKSGHIARKIAATLSSTGQPAYFVHPGEASHGDLGMITKDDVIIALSFSGETKEIYPLVAYAKRFDIPLIAITKNETSSLAHHSDCLLKLPSVKEACPMGLAPTTSTTMMMALGDALAVTLLKKRGFSKKDFGLFHPGGSLGQQLVLVRDRMHHGDEMPLCSLKTSMVTVVDIISTKNFGCVGIIDESGKMRGIITDGDLRRSIQKGIDFTKSYAKDIMKKDPITIAPSLLMAEALKFLQQKSITSLFVVEEEKPCGLIHIHDFLKSGVL